MASVKGKNKSFNKTNGNSDRKKAFLEKSNAIKVKKGLIPTPKINQKKTAATKQPEWWVSGTAPKTVLIQLKEDTKWFDGAPSFAMEEGQYKVPREALDAIMAAVPKQFEEEVRLYHTMKKKNMDSDQKWIADVVKSGTLTDKVAALALSIQESPVHQLSSLDLLVEMAQNKKQQRTSQIALEALKDLLLHNLLPDERKLQGFSKQPFGHPNMTMKAALVLWYEGQLAARVGKILDALDFWLRCTTSVDFFKKTCLTIISEMLIAKPEQEARLLNMLVNKLADPAPAVSNKAIELLKLVTKNHEMMKLHIVKEVKSLIYQTNTSPKAIFACTVYLTQMPLVPHRDAKVAEELIDCYVSLFEKALVNSNTEKESGKSDKGKGKGKGKGKLSEKEKQAEQAAQSGSRLLAILLNGINHAYPCVVGSSVGSGLSKHMDALYKIVHTTSFSTATQALMLLSQAVLKDDNVGTASSKKSKKSGKKESSAAATPTSLDQDAAHRFFRALYSQLQSEQVCSRSKNTLFLNLLYRSLKRDDNKERIMSFVKRMCMASTQSNAAITAGLLLLVSEVCKEGAGNGTVLPAMTEQPPAAPSALDNALADDDEEDDNHAAELRGLFDCYDSAKRDPAYALTKSSAGSKEGVSGEDSTAGVCLWELNLLQQHFHPSVRAFANSLVDQSDEPSVNAHEISFAGDPITEFSLTSFLDRLSYKHSKKQSRNKKGSTEEEVPINLDSQINTVFDESAAVVAPDKVFFHKYFGSRIQLREEGRSRDRSRNKGRGDGDDSDEESDANSEDEMDAFADKLMNDAMKSNQPVDFDDEDFSDEGSEGGSDQDGDMGMDGDDMGSDDFDSDDSGSEDSENEVFAEAPVSDDETDMDQYYIDKYGGAKFKKQAKNEFADSDDEEEEEEEEEEIDDSFTSDSEPELKPCKKRKSEKPKSKEKNKKRK